MDWEISTGNHHNLSENFQQALTITSAVQIAISHFKSNRIEQWATGRIIVYYCCKSVWKFPFNIKVPENVTKKKLLQVAYSNYFTRHICGQGYGRIQVLVTTGVCIDWGDSKYLMQVLNSADGRIGRIPIPRH